MERLPGSVCLRCSNITRDCRALRTTVAMIRAPAEIVGGGGGAAFTAAHKNECAVSVCAGAGGCLARARPQQWRWWCQQRRAQHQCSRLSKVRAPHYTLCARLRSLLHLGGVFSSLRAQVASCTLGWTRLSGCNGQNPNQWAPFARTPVSLLRTPVSFAADTGVLAADTGVLSVYSSTKRCLSELLWQADLPKRRC